MGFFRQVTLIAVLLACLGCASQTGGGLADLDWLLGDWVARDGAITEHWERVSGDTFEGSGVTRSGGNVSIETLRLVTMSGNNYYIAKVPHNEVPVAFRLTEESTGERAVFVNPTHDFPRMIVYELDESGNMVVTVSDGGEKGFQIRFSRSSKRDRS